MRARARGICVRVSVPSLPLLPARTTPARPGLVPPFPSAAPLHLTRFSLPLSACRLPFGLVVKWAGVSRFDDLRFDDIQKEIDRDLMANSNSVASFPQQRKGVTKGITKMAMTTWHSSAA